MLRGGLFQEPSRCSHGLGKPLPLSDSTATSFGKLPMHKAREVLAVWFSLLNIHGVWGEGNEKDIQEEEKETSFLKKITGGLILKVA